MAGIWLGSLYMLVDRPPARLGWQGVLHAAGGLIGFACLVIALRENPPTLRAVKMGVSAFGVFSGALIGVALAIGVTILVRHLGRRTIPLGLVAAHGLLAVFGYTLLLTYLTMLY
jgi:hypothetical protein